MGRRFVPPYVASSPSGYLADTLSHGPLRHQCRRETRPLDGQNPIINKPRRDSTPTGLFLSTVEIGCNEFLNLLRIVLDVFAQAGVVEGAQLGNDAVDHGRREHAVLLEHLALALQTVGRGHARVGQLGQGGQAVGILGSVDVHVDVGLFGHLQCVSHLEAVAAGHAQAGQQLVEVGRAVGRAHLHRLLDARVVLRGFSSGLAIGTYPHRRPSPAARAPAPSGCGRPSTRWWAPPDGAPGGSSSWGSCCRRR